MNPSLDPLWMDCIALHCIGLDCNTAMLRFDTIRAVLGFRSDCIQFLRLDSKQAFLARDQSISNRRLRERTTIVGEVGANRNALSLNSIMAVPCLVLHIGFHTRLVLSQERSKQNGTRPRLKTMQMQMA
mmetsp:Transcript_8150/g.24098  ORF Transcript_8150/g.24098 Transcript_8150/m.24098 type:complete len:129 (-) Transcript_8150:714-1100(-)